MAKTKTEGRLRRKKRIRRDLSGTDARPRLSIFKSDRHISGQIINDEVHSTLVCASSLEKTFKSDKDMPKIAGAKKIGALLAERAIAKGIKAVVFDRNGFAYHGRVKAFADAAREKGLSF
ncbi:MAG: 50S ribosomal protein L18 [Deltaproteobacteria bacterium CG11_big_fil_rev_8_21_14_0_20_49_13]|nr:MAG: 50S ribosomal protein L18 [Deltaproteobacteria bacterium CG11_big_fil_rev_8_21_14_0_20_49_13]